jgi:hypothetical protein
MQKIIADTVALDHRPFVVTPDEGANSIILQAAGHALRIGPDEARRLARALLQAASIVERAAQGEDEGPDE